MEIIKKYFPNVTPNQVAQFGALQDLYAEWNEQINVVSRKDIDHLYERHVLHSLGIAKVMNFKKDTAILDVGTGGGFPGIPLAILFPSCYFHLIDSIGKKITVVKAIAEELDLENVKAEQIRAENVPYQYDFVVSRAVTQLPKFVGWIKNKITKKGFNDLPNGLLALKGGDLGEEIGPYGVNVFQLKDFFEEEFFETKKVLHLPKHEFGRK